MHDQKQIYSLRKLSVGLASVIVGTCFFISTNGQNVKADTLNVGEQPTSTVIQQDSSKKQEQDSNEQNDQTNVSNSKTEQQQSTNERNDVENVDSNLNDTDKLGNATKPVESEANQKFDQAKDKFKQDTSIDANDPSSVTKNIKKIQTNTLKVVKKSTVNPDSLSLKESKAVNLNNNNNGGFDEATWGTLDVNNWKGSVQGDYYQLMGYTGDANHVIVPNEADFAKAGISTSGKQVGVTRDLMFRIFRDKTTAQDATVAFSKTDNKEVKAINADWSNTWGHNYFVKARLSRFDGTNLDVSNVTNMSHMFEQNQISDLSTLANWKVDHMTNMSGMFRYNQVSDLSPLANWKVDHVTNMDEMFRYNQISDLSPLANWNVNNVTNMGFMFKQNQISDLSPLANWNVNNVTNMGFMFKQNQISDLSPLTNWNVNNVGDMSQMFEQNQISDLSPLAKWNVNNVMGMGQMFADNQISDLSPLTNWNVNNVGDMSQMFEQNQISDLSPLAKWNVNNVMGMGQMFADNQISDLSPLTNWNVNNVGDMSGMFWNNQISDLSPLTNWNVNNVGDMSGMFWNNQISDLSPLTNWKVDNVFNISGMFYSNRISDVSPLASWKVDNVTDMSHMFDHNVTTQTKNLQAKRVINFAYPDGYTGKPQDPVTQTIDVPQKVQVELITKDSKSSNNILDWVTKKETPEASDPVYFQDYTVPTVSNLVPSISTVAKQEADPNIPLNVVVTYTASPVTVHFVDTDENADKDSDAVKNVLNQTMQLSGTYGSNVDLSTVKLPANFVLDDTLPSVQYGKTDSVTINLKHYINDVKAENAEDATRTIVINKYDGHGNLTSTQTVVQQIAFYKHDYVDAVTNNVKSSKYIFDDKSSPALSHNVIDGKATNDPSYTLKDGKYYFAKYKLDVPAGYKAEEKKINPNMMMISLFALPTTLTDPNTSQTDTNKKPDTSSSSVTDKPNNSHNSHNDSKKQNDQPIISNNETDHTINVSAQAVDPTVEPERNNVASSNNSTTSAQTQPSSTNDAEQPTNISNTDRVVNDQTDDDNFADPSREENDNSKAPEKASNWSKPKAGKITHVNLKTPQNSLNEAVRGQSVATHPATSVINNSKSDAKQLPQTGEKDNYTYSALGLLLGLNVSMTAAYVEKKRKKY